jgi:hypothetical protein
MKIETFALEKKLEFSLMTIILLLIHQKVAESLFLMRNMQRMENQF